MKDLNITINVDKWIQEIFKVLMTNRRNLVIHEVIKGIISKYIVKDNLEGERVNKYVM